MLLISNKGVSIGVDTLPERKKPCLVVKQNNTETKYASFNNNFAANEFMMIFAKFCGIDEVAIQKALEEEAKDGKLDEN